MPLGAPYSPLQTGNQQMVQAQRDMMGSLNAQADTQRAALAGLSAEHARAAGSIDTTMANFTGTMQNLGGTIAQSANNTGDLVSAIAQHHGIEQAGRDEVLGQILQHLSARPAQQVDARQVHVDARHIGLDQKTGERRCAPTGHGC